MPFRCVFLSVFARCCRRVAAWAPSCSSASRTCWSLRLARGRARRAAGWLRCRPAWRWCRSACGSTTAASCRWEGGSKFRGPRLRWDTQGAAKDLSLSISPAQHWQRACRSGTGPLGPSRARCAHELFLQFRCDEKGFLAICAFGLPGRSHEDGPARGIQVALAIVEAIKVRWRVRGDPVPSFCRGTCSGDVPHIAGCCIEQCMARGCLL